ncbi:hypothetical protein YTCETSXE_CDS0007 [Staphylococcus phage MVC_VPHSA2]|nr:hypothetical protein YTCETSXE_CDS0007 [Staphylococcus phage MVC_VPHSA2]
MANLYGTIKEALYNQLVNGFNASTEKVDVYKVHYQNIAQFPAVAIELSKRGKAKKGLGVSERNLTVFVWVYTDLLDSEEAEEQCYEILELAEKIIEEDKTLNGTAAYLSIDDDAEFGQVLNGEANFLQGAKLVVNIRGKLEG